MREARQNHRGMVFRLTGMPGAGKSTLAHFAEAVLFRQNNILVLDGDAVRSGLCRDLGFSADDRRENNHRVAELARLFAQSGQICTAPLFRRAPPFARKPNASSARSAFAKSTSPVRLTISQSRIIHNTCNTYKKGYAHVHYSIARRYGATA